MEKGLPKGYYDRPDLERNREGAGRLRSEIFNLQAAKQFPSTASCHYYYLGRVISIEEWKPSVSQAAYRIHAAVF